MSDSMTTAPASSANTEPARCALRRRHRGPAGRPDPETWWHPSADPIENAGGGDLGYGGGPDPPDLSPTPPARPLSSFEPPARGAPESLSRADYFTCVGRPVNNNTARVVEFAQHRVDPAGTTGQNLVTGDTSVSTWCVSCASRSSTTCDAALAEIEVQTIGFNLALKVNTEGRVAGAQRPGGRPDLGTQVPAAQRHRRRRSSTRHRRPLLPLSRCHPEWRTWGRGWVDGNVFRIDRVVWLLLVVGETYLYGHDRERHHLGPLRRLTSGGVYSNSPTRTWRPRDTRCSPASITPSAPSAGSILLPSGNPVWRLMPGAGNGSGGRAARLDLPQRGGTGPGRPGVAGPDSETPSHPPRAGDADTPPDTRIEVETQTGNGFQDHLLPDQRPGGDQGDYEAAMRGSAARSSTT